MTILFYFSLSCYAQWIQTNGPAGGQSMQIISIKNYLVVNGYDGGIFRSADKGKTWQPVNNGLPDRIRCFDLDIYNDTIYVATFSGLYYSADVGDSWQVLASEIFAFSVEVVGEEIYAGASTHYGMHYSSDHGQSWTMLYPDGPLNTVRNILRQGDKIWAATSSGYSWSTDDGLSWSVLSPRLYGSTLRFIEGELFYAGMDDWGFFEVYRSTDNGNNWTQLLNIELDGFLPDITKKGNEIFIAGGSKFFYSANNGANWKVTNLPVGLPGKPAFITMDGSDIFVSYHEGIVFSSDKGATWERRNVGYVNHNIFAMAASDDAVVAFNEFSGVYVSTNEGDSWNSVHDPDRLISRRIYAYGDAIIMCYELDIYRSKDSGKTWQRILKLVDDIPGEHGVPVPHITGYKESLVLTTYWGVYLSKDFGTTWEFVPDSRFNDVQLFRTFVQEDVIVLVTADGFYYSTSFGKDWVKKPAPDIVTVNDRSVTGMIIQHPFLTMSTGSGLFKSIDFGSTWKKANFIEGPLFDVDYVEGATIVSAFRGVYIFKEGEWFNVTDNLKTLPQSLVIKDEYAYVGTWGKGVWKRPISELLEVSQPISIAGTLTQPVLEVNCKSITVTNPEQGAAIKWYKDGTLIENESGNMLRGEDAAIYFASYETPYDITISDTVSVEGSAATEVDLFNVVTPGNDGNNDFLFLDDMLVGSTLQVFDRWGSLVYWSESYHNDWRPDNLSSGVYYYIVDSDCHGIHKTTLSVLQK